MVSERLWRAGKLPRTLQCGVLTLILSLSSVILTGPGIHFPRWGRVTADPSVRVRHIKASSQRTKDTPRYPVIQNQFATSTEGRRVRIAGSI